MHATSQVLESAPEELRERFFALQSRADVARLLDLTVKQLNFHLYVLSPDQKYKVFEVAKKSGGTRKISAPASPIKIIQRKLKQVLDAVYIPKPSTQGFVAGRSIVSNAQIHKKRRYVLNLDLEDFFPSIHFGRVRGMFMGNPFRLSVEVSTILAQICCHEGALPQGAPTSPTISNMMCARLDAKLQQLAKTHQCTYSRYADDITFSTNRSRFPTALALLSGIGQVEIGKELASTIQDNGFRINPQKTRLQVRQQRQAVTGLTVNKYANVRRQYIKQVRAILHAWNKYGLDSTALNYFTNHSDAKYSNPHAYRPPFPKIVFGKLQFIGMVKGKNNSAYLGLLREFMRLDPEYVKYTHYPPAAEAAKPFIYTEGKTDRKHLTAALRYFRRQGLFPNLELEYAQEDYAEGDTKLLQRLKITSEHKEPHQRPHIFIFDRDKHELIEQIKGDTEYKLWGNNVYSLAIPIPKHRQELKEICIELYYRDEDIVRPDLDGRRLYLSREFNSTSGMHQQELSDVQEV